MKTTARVLSLIVFAALLVGCGRTDRTSNSDPISDQASDRNPAPPPATAPGAQGTAPATGADSTGRPSDASGGTTGAGAGSGTSGTAMPPAK